MADSARAKANRVNALKSTGPRTPEGKAIVARNAVKHGLLSRETLMVSESRAEFRAVAVGIREHYQPAGQMESLLVDQIVAAVWRLRRIYIIENQTLFPHNYLNRYSWGGVVPENILKLSRYEAGIHRGLYRAIQELERLQSNRTNNQQVEPIVLDVSASDGQESI